MLKSLIVYGKQKKEFRSLAKMFSNFGFSKIKVSKKSLLVEKSLGKTLEGKPQIDYSVLFEKNKITFSYTEFAGEKRARYFESIKTFINILVISNDFYSVELREILNISLKVVELVEKTVGVAEINISEKADMLDLKNKQLSAKYQDLVKSSEENARLLLEAERRVEELAKRVLEMEGISDEILKEEIFNWIRMHAGAIDVSEFSLSYNLPKKRVEEGINILIKEGYIKKRS
ncbi:MAG: hypothetical protein WC309_04730 [Candidatus Paceibacterota bacterium]|jgi:hypothetical protein